MHITTLEIANTLFRQIKQLEDGLNCFEYIPEGGGEPISLNPILIVEHDYDGREQCRIPMELSDSLIKILKDAMIKKRELLIAEFASL